MLLLDVKRRCWSQQMLSICGITEQALPKLHESYEVVGTLLPQLAEQLGLPSSVRIVAGAGDNAAAAIGTGTVGEGSCNLSLGTSGTLFITSGQFRVDPHNALHAFCPCRRALSSDGLYAQRCLLQRLVDAGDIEHPGFCRRAEGHLPAGRKPRLFPALSDGRTFARTMTRTHAAPLSVCRWTPPAGR